MANTQQMANAIRALAMDAVQQANSGHPGAPMGMADMAVALWGDQPWHWGAQHANSGSKGSGRSCGP